MTALAGRTSTLAPFIATKALKNMVDLQAEPANATT